MNYGKLKFEIREDVASADYIFDAYGDSLNELFAACAAACFSAMTELQDIRTVREYSLELKGENIEELLYAFISELIYLKDTEKFFFSAFNVDIAPDSKSLRAVVTGEPIDHKRHKLKTDVKAATYHELKISEFDGGFKAHMILDL